MWICFTSKLGFRVKTGMSSESKKGETKKTIILGWRWVVGCLAYIYNALLDGVLSLTSLHSSKLSSSAEECEHTNIVTGELYYGLGEHQYTEYYYCEECGEEMFNEDTEW